MQHRPNLLGGSFKNYATFPRGEDLIVTCVRRRVVTDILVNHVT